MADAVVRVQSNRAVITLGGGEVVAFQAAQAAAPYAERAEDALTQIEQIATGAPDAPSVLNKVNRNGSNVEADAFRGAIGADVAANSFMEGRGAGSVPLNLQRWIDTNPINVTNYFQVIDADYTNAFARAVNYALTDRTSPTGNNGWGCRTILFPKGRFVISGGYTAASSAIGLTVAGECPHATTIEFHNDTQAFFSVNTFIAVSFKNIRISHVAQNPDRSTWTNALFRGTGAGGGQLLTFENVYTNNWNRIVENLGIVNFDTFSATHCGFVDFKTFYYGRNSQAVVNLISHCALGGQGDVFDVAGVGHTTFDTCNIVVDGAWLKLTGVAGLFGVTAQYVFINTKGEPFNRSAFPGGSRSSIISLAGDRAQISAQIKLINCGMISSVAFDTDPAYPQIEMTSNMNIDWQGGSLQATAKIKLWPAQILDFNSLNHRGLFFDSLRVIPLPTQITREAATSVNTTHPQVTYERCQGVNNITIGSPIGTFPSFPPKLDRATQENCISSGAHRYAPLTFGPALTHSLLFYGSNQCIQSLIINVVRKVGGGAITVETSLLPDFSVILDTLTITGAAGSSYLDAVNAPASVGKVTNNGIYVRCSGVESYGYIFATHRAV